MSNLICRSKIAYFKEKLSSCDNKELYRTLDCLLNRKLPSLPFCNSVEALCDNFSTFFSEKIKKIQRSIDDDDSYPTSNQSDDGHLNFEPLSHLDPATEDEVLKTILRSPNKSCSLDHIPTWFLKENVYHLVPVLTKIINSSLQSGIFPSSLRSAVIRPLLKKPKLDQNCLSNYL